MKFSIRERIRDWLLRDEPDYVDNEKDECIVREKVREKVRENDSDDFQIDHDSTIHFQVVPASGGRIVQIRYYDRIKDRGATKLHVITPDENLAESLAQIFQIETLSR